MRMSETRGRKFRVAFDAAISLPRGELPSGTIKVAVPPDGPEARAFISAAPRMGGTGDPPGDRGCLAG